jgi:hypothetical protein
MRNALAHAGKTQRRVVSIWIGTAFAQDDAEAARKQWRQVVDGARPRVSKLAALMDDARADVLACMEFPAQHRTKIHQPARTSQGRDQATQRDGRHLPTKPPGGSSDAYLSVFAGDSSVRAFAAAMNMLTLAS